MNTESYAKELRSIFDRNAYSTLIAQVGDQLNDRKDRFDKSDIIEQAVAIYSSDRLIWVDLIGRDHVDPVREFDLEFKYVSNGLFTKIQKLPKKTIYPVPDGSDSRRSSARYPTWPRPRWPRSW